MTIIHALVSFKNTANGYTDHTDFNECANQNDLCHQECVNDYGSYHCDCYTGYIMSSNKVICEGKKACS